MVTQPTHLRPSVTKVIGMASEKRLVVDLGHNLTHKMGVFENARQGECADNP